MANTEEREGDQAGCGGGNDPKHGKGGRGKAGGKAGRGKAGDRAGGGAPKIVSDFEKQLKKRVNALAVDCKRAKSQLADALVPGPAKTNHPV